jgi:hypothetical protein
MDEGIMLGWHELARAPQRPGLYAWYCRPHLRPADLADTDATRANLHRLAEQLRIPRLDVSADGHLSLRLRGQLDHIHVATDGDSVSALVGEVLATDSSRALFATMLDRALPHLMAPLYIGVAVDLRRRLDQHRAAIENLRAPAPALASVSVDAASEYAPAHSFAREVARRAIPARMLVAFVVPVATLEDHATDEAEQRRVAEAVETVLNRLFYPILGRR